MKGKKRIFVGILLCVSFLCGSKCMEKQKQVLFLVDASSSMAYHQKMELAESLLTLFTTAAGEDCAIEVLYYNDDILTGKTLPQGNTDIGFALQKAMEQVEDNTTVILLSDGETDLQGSYTGRTEEQSAASLVWACQKAKEKQCTIETVAMGNWDTSVLEGIATETGGMLLTVKGEESLREVFSTLYERIMGNVVLPLGMGSVFNVETEKYDEDGIEVVVYGKVATVSDEKAEVITGEGYCIVRSLSGDAITIEAEGTVVADRLRKRSIAFHMEEITDKNAFRIPIILKAYDKENGKEIVPKEYEHISASVTVKEEKTGAETAVMLEKGEKGFSGIFLQETEGWYTFISKVSYGDSQQEIETMEIYLGNTPPLQRKKERLRFLLTGKKREILLSDYFVEQDGEKLTYAIEELPKGVVGEVIGDRLYLKGTEETEGSVRLSVTDERGTTIQGEIPIEIQPVWVYGKPFVLGGIGLSMLFSFLAVKRKEKEKLPQRGRLLLEFLETAQEKELPVYHWNLSAIPEKGISLGTLFGILEIQEERKEADAIYLSWKKKGIVLQHNTDCLLQKEGKSVGRKVILQEGECLIILFEERKTALQILYEGGKNYGDTGRYCRQQ